MSIFGKPDQPKRPPTTRTLVVYGPPDGQVRLNYDGHEYIALDAVNPGRYVFLNIPTMGGLNCFIEKVGQQGVGIPGWKWYGQAINPAPPPAINEWFCQQVDTSHNPTWFQMPLMARANGPDTWTTDQLLAIRGAMWTARLNLPYGPRPGQDDNILAMDYYQKYSAADQQRMLAAYGPRSPRKYTHAVSGPLIDPGAYHGQYPATPNLPSQGEFDAYLDDMDEWWADGICNIHFAKPDAVQEIADMAALDALYRQPRAQRLLRVVVYTGWEPWKYEKTNAQWIEWLKHAIDVFPNAIHLVHTVGETDALTGGDDDKALGPDGNAVAWQRAAPYLHGWLIQNTGYALSKNPVPDPTFARNFRNQFDPNAGRDSTLGRFRQGKSPFWTSASLNADGKGLRIYGGEYAAYGDYWDNLPEEEARKLGDAALAAGADGVLDGCH